MTLLIGLFPSAFVESKAVTSWRWMAALLLALLPVPGVATEFDRFQNKGDDQNDHGNNFEVSHDPTSFNFRIQR